MSKKEIKEIVEKVGKKHTWEIDFWPPFIHRYTWVFGGWCGTCGDWNWQWRTENSIFGATAPCKKCLAD